MAKVAKPAVDSQVLLADIPFESTLFQSRETETAIVERYKRVLADREAGIQSIAWALRVHAIGAALFEANSQDIVIFKQLLGSGQPHQSDLESYLETILAQSRSFATEKLLENLERAHAALWRCGSNLEKLMSFRFVEEVQRLVLSYEGHHREILQHYLHKKEAW